MLRPEASKKYERKHDHTREERQYHYPSQCPNSAVDESIKVPLEQSEKIQKKQNDITFEELSKRYVTEAIWKDIDRVQVIDIDGIPECRTCFQVKEESTGFVVDGIIRVHTHVSKAKLLAICAAAGGVIMTFYKFFA